MEITKTNTLVLVCVLMIIGLVSCNKFLDVRPEDRFLSNDVFKDETAVYNALNGIYLNLAKRGLYGGQLTMSTVDVMAQYYNPGAFWKQTADYNYKDATLQSTYSSIWRSAYVAILNVNSFLAKIDQSASVSNERKNLLKGEAYGIRAFVHFDLLRLFGPVYTIDSDKSSIPYLTVPTEKIQSLLPAKVVVDSILADLGRAELLLENDPVRTQGIVLGSGTDRLSDFVTLRNRRLNYYAVLGIKARVLLFKGDKVGALAAATKIIDQAGKWFPWTVDGLTLPGIQNPDRTFSSEVIFGLQNYDLYNQQKELFSAVLKETVILAPLTERLSEVYEDNGNDYRLRINWVPGAAYGKTYKTFVKYDDVINKTLLFRNLQPLLRISELYYIAAECTTDPNAALKYVNEVRKNRGLTELSGNVVLRDVLQKEYRKEFWGEGQLFYYYKRNNVASIPSGVSDKNTAMTAAKYVVPLPLSETQNR
ncbi:RagB/SusD family nutrient uptake outer membrane protein [Sphingobacterium sp.]|uniref:RagB/SusD family nutrient uptake outer membrane protein n=1 Tax=Sphingobacterium sp. TaxID=341027 RepID=UPI0031E2ED0A